MLGGLLTSVKSFYQCLTPIRHTVAGKNIGLDDIVFHNDDTRCSHNDSPYRPFVIKRYTSGDTSTTTQNSGLLKTQRPVHLVVLSLGALLIQLIVGKIVDELDVTDDMDAKSIISKREIGGRLADCVLEQGGMNYLAAVN
ncbi:hypothetical protein F4815DRAFT_483973 [Daldinia loculata]|nr:hypothetical protein F4815DRAFT_483973 [Daldinia loculata]